MPRFGRDAVRQVVAVLALLVIGVAGWNIGYQIMHPPDPYAVDLTKPFRFADDAESNVPLDDAGLEGLAFRTPRGEPVTLGAYRGRKHVVLVVTRGRTERAEPGAYVGRICLYCASQTSRLIANYAAFARHDAEVVVVRGPVVGDHELDRHGAIVGDRPRAGIGRVANDPDDRLSGRRGGAGLR